MKRSSVSFDLQLLKFQCLLSQLAVGTLGKIKGERAVFTAEETQSGVCVLWLQ